MARTKKISPQWRVAARNLPEKLDGRISSFRIGFCNVGGVSNARFLMAALIPPDVICGDPVPTIVFEPSDARLMLFWLGVANSFVLDFLARKKAALHMSYTVMDSLPLPRMYRGSETERAIAIRALRLAATGSEMHPFLDKAAAILGASTEGLEPTEDIQVRNKLRAEIDVIVARDLFELTRQEMRYVLDPGDILGRDCGFETFGALMRAELRAHKAFVTRDLILSTWDSLPVTSAMSESATLVTAGLPVPPDAIDRLPARAWARHDQNQAAATEAILAAVLKKLRGASPARLARQAAVLCLNPRALLSRLTSDEQAHWRRVVGTEAEPLQGATQLMPAANAAWREATVHLRATGRLVVNSTDDIWAVGVGLDQFPTAGWADGRAQFVLSVLQRTAASPVVEDAGIEEQISALAG